MDNGIMDNVFSPKVFTIFEDTIIRKHYPLSIKQLSIITTFVP